MKGELKKRAAFIKPIEELQEELEEDALNLEELDAELDEEY